MMRADMIQTFTGRAVSPTSMEPEDVVIEDIAHSLSMQCRFTGHVKHWYSVAEHSVRVSRYVEATEPEHALWALLHDASEAYLVDVAAPIKHTAAFEPFRSVEDRILAVVCRRFGLPEQEPPIVKIADKVLLETEARDLMAPLHPDWKPSEHKPLTEIIFPWDQVKAKAKFLKRFERLMAEKLPRASAG